MPQMSARASGSKHTLASPDVSHAIEEDWAFDDFSQEPVSNEPDPSKKARRKRRLTMFKSPITPREQPNHPRQRSCKVARKLCTPTRSAQSSVERLHLDPFEPEPLMLNDEFQSGLQKVFEAFDVICAERNAREYTSLFEKLGARRLSEIFVRSLAKQSIPLVQALWKGQLPSSEDLGRAPRIAACSDINVSGVYIHVARDGEIPFASGAYIGSGAAEKGDTNFGMSNISGVLERVWCQHGSQAFRKYQDDKSRGNRGVAHYRMYKAGDTPQQHHYVLLSYLTFDEVKTLLHHAQATIDQAELHERYALTRSFEAVFIITTGMYTNDKQVMDSIKEFGWEVPQPSILRLNRSAGLEVSSPEDHTAHLARSRAGGLAAQLTYGKAMGLGVGEKGSLTGYLHAKGWQNPDLPKEAAEAGRDKVYKDSLMLWMNEKFIRVRFQVAQVHISANDSEPFEAIKSPVSCTPPRAILFSITSRTNCSDTRSASSRSTSVCAR